MNNQLEVFRNAEFGEIRTVEIGNEIFFVATDVCRALEISNPSKAVSRLDDDERSNFKLGRQGNANVVNEYGLYNLVLASRKPTAKAFKRWITHEVIPAIRKTGSYTTTPVDNLKAERLAVMKQNAKVREAKLWEKLAQTTENQTYKEICTAYAANTLAGKRLLELPEVKEEERTYSAGDIGKMLGGASASKVGRLANAYGLKTPQYGKFFVDKARNSNKQVETFRYYITALPAFRKAVRDDFHKKLDSELDLEFGEE